MERSVDGKSDGGVYGNAGLLSRMKSGRADSNCRPPAPKAGALTKLRYAPFRKLSYTKYRILERAIGSLS